MSLLVRSRACLKRRRSNIAKISSCQIVHIRPIRPALRTRLQGIRPLLPLRCASPRSLLISPLDRLRQQSSSKASVCCDGPGLAVIHRARSGRRRTSILPASAVGSSPGAVDGVLWSARCPRCRGSASRALSTAWLDALPDFRVRCSRGRHELTFAVGYRSVRPRCRRCIG